MKAVFVVNKIRVRRLMATLVAVAALALLGAPMALAGEQFESTRQGFSWKHGPEWIRFDRGRWSAGIDGGGVVHWHMFFWHDHYIYEKLPGGTVKSSPTLARDGSLVQQGTFSAREKSLPMQYAYRIRPTADGVRVACELQKTGPLALSNGIWLHIMGDRQTLRGSERIWLEPSAFGRLTTNVQGVGNRLHVELRPGRAISFGDSGLHESNTENTQNYTYRLNVFPGDFEAGKRVVVEYQVRFGDLPASFPGEIKPMRRPLAIGRVEPAAARVPQFGKLELSVALSASYENPFDPDQVRLDARFTAPSGKETCVPGFFMVDFRRSVQPGAELLTAEGNGAWKIRFTPREPGRHSWRLTLVDRTGKTSGGDGQF